MESNKDKYKLSILDKDEKVYMFFESDLQELIANERAAEREACAKVCEKQKIRHEERAAESEEFRDINPEVARIAGMTCDFNAAAIRARGRQ